MDLFDTQPLLADVTGLPSFYVDAVVRCDLGNGIASFINCRKQNGVIVPQCEVIVSAINLLSFGRATSDFALELYRRQQTAHMTETIGMGH
jgi:hypothetical protein